ncbi:MAG: DUF6043 family protein [Rikenellaceae bacterium]
MPQKEYDAFLASLKQWITDNQDDFDEFEEMMANEPEQGYFSILQQSITYLPALKKMAAKKLNSKDEVEISDIVKVAEESGLAQRLLATFKNKGDIPFIPAMLSWLYYGRSFEGMVENGEKIIDSPNTSWLERLKCLAMIKILIWNSKKLKIRTQEDWDDYYKLRKVVGDTKSLDWAMEKAATKKVGRKSSEIKPIIEFLSDTLTTRQKQTLVKLIETYLKDHSVEIARHVATMIYMLEHRQHLRSYTKRSFYESIKAEFDIEIGSETLINNYLNPKNVDKNIKEQEIMVAEKHFTLKNYRVK